MPTSATDAQTPTLDAAGAEQPARATADAVRGPNDGVPPAALATLPGPLPQHLVDAADPDVHPGRPAGRVHGGRGDGRPVAEEGRLAFWEAVGRRLTWAEDFTRVLGVNLVGPFLGTKALAPLIRDSGGGAIVNIGSMSGFIVNRPQWQPA